MIPLSRFYLNKDVSIPQLSSFVRVSTTYSTPLSYPFPFSLFIAPAHNLLGTPDSGAGRYIRTRHGARRQPASHAQCSRGAQGHGPTICSSQQVQETSCRLSCPRHRLCALHSGLAGEASRRRAEDTLALGRQADSSQLPATLGWQAGGRHLRDYQRDHARRARFLALECAMYGAVAGPAHAPICLHRHSSRWRLLPSPMGSSQNVQPAMGLP